MIINGNIYLNKSSINNLGKLKKVNGDLFLSYCFNLKNLSKLKEVTYHLNLKNCNNLETLGDLKTVNSLNVEGYEKLRDLGKIQILKNRGVFKFDFSGLKSLKSINLIEVRNIIDFRNCVNLQSLENLEIVDGSIFLQGCKNLKSLGKLRNISGKIEIDNNTGLTKEYIESLNYKIRNKINNIDNFRNLFK